MSIKANKNSNHIVDFSLKERPSSTLIFSNSIAKLNIDIFDEEVEIT